MFNSKQELLVHFDEQVVAKATSDDLAPEHWKRFRTERTKDSRAELRLTIYAAGGKGPTADGR